VSEPTRRIQTVLSTGLTSPGTFPAIAVPPGFRIVIVYFQCRAQLAAVGNILVNMNFGGGPGDTDWTSPMGVANDWRMVEINPGGGGIVGQPAIGVGIIMTVLGSPGVVIKSLLNYYMEPA